MIRTGLMFALCSIIALAQEAALTNEVVIKMVQSGVPADTVVRTITSAEKVSFSFLPTDLPAMSNAKVPEEVFKAMARRDKTVGPTAIAVPVVAVALPAKPTSAAPSTVAVAKPAPTSVYVSTPSGKDYSVKYSGGSLESVKSGEDLKLFVVGRKFIAASGRLRDSPLSRSESEPWWHSRNPRSTISA